MSSHCKTRVVLLACGSFNPLTNMHLRMFELARDHLEDTGQYQVVRGILSPVGDSSKKKGLIEACYRVEIARLGTENSDWIMVDPWESSQTEWVETVQVVRHHYEELLASEQSNDGVDTVRLAKIRRVEESKSESSIHHRERDDPQLMVLCGTDVLESFGIPNLWKQEDIAEIVGRFGLVCITRNGSKPSEFICQSDVLQKYHYNIHMVQESVANEISATHVRSSLCRGQSVRYLVPDRVLHYIQEHQLYGFESEQENGDIALMPLHRYTKSGNLGEIMQSITERKNTEEVEEIPANIEDNNKEGTLEKDPEKDMNCKWWVAQLVRSLVMRVLDKGHSPHPHVYLESTYERLFAKLWPEVRKEGLDITSEKIKDIDKKIWKNLCKMASKCCPVKVMNLVISDDPIIDSIIVSIVMTKLKKTKRKKVAAQVFLSMWRPGIQ